MYSGKHRQGWTADENEQLKSMVANGVTVVRAAAAFRRTTIAVRNQARKLGVPFECAGCGLVRPQTLGGRASAAAMRKKPITPSLSKQWTVYPVGKKTRVNLESEFWEAFHEIAAREKLSLTDLTGQIVNANSYANSKCPYLCGVEGGRRRS
jgi:hypothetical protein